MDQTQTYNKLTGRRNLYLISQNVNNGYDTYSSAVVACWTEEEARNTHPSPYRDADDEYDSRDWAPASSVNVELIGLAEPDYKGIICSSFHAG